MESGDVREKMKKKSFADCEMYVLDMDPNAQFGYCVCGRPRCGARLGRRPRPPPLSPTRGRGRLTARLTPRGVVRRADHTDAALRGKK